MRTARHKDAKVVKPAFFQVHQETLGKGMQRCDVRRGVRLKRAVMLQEPINRVFFLWSVQVNRGSKAIPRRRLHHCAARWAQGHSPKPILTIALILVSSMIMVTLTMAVQQLLLLRPLRQKKCHSPFQPCVHWQRQMHWSRDLPARSRANSSSANATRAAQR